MTIGTLFNQGSPSHTATNAASGFEVANRFIVTERSRLKKVGWRRPNTTANNKPVNLRVWDGVTGTVFYTVSPIPDDGVVGWQWHTVPSPPEMIASRIYVVSAYYNANTGYPQGSGSFPVTPQAPLQVANPQRASGAPNTPGFPTTTDNNFWYLFDVEVETDPPDEPDHATISDLENALVRWLDSDEDNTRPNGLPMLLYNLMLEVQTQLDGGVATIDTINTNLTNALGPAGNLLTGALRNYLDGLSNSIQLVRDQVEPGMAIPTQIAQTETDIIAAVNAAAGSGFVPLYNGGAGWTQADQTTGDGHAVWVQGADAYVFHIENAVESQRTQRAVGTETLWWLRGWAKPWDGTRWGPEHIEVNGLTSIIQGKRRWEGIGLWVPPDVEWTLTAYDYTG